MRGSRFLLLRTQQDHDYACDSSPDTDLLEAPGGVSPKIVAMTVDRELLKILRAHWPSLLPLAPHTGRHISSGAHPRFASILSNRLDSTIGSASWRRVEELTSALVTSQPER